MNDAKLFKLAKAGDLDALLEAIVGDEEDDVEVEAEEEEEDEEDDGDYGDDDGEEGSGSSAADDAAYKWLHVAADFGADEAREMADDMLETSSLRYDDEGMSVGLIHLELGQAYLSGDAPFSVDHAKAKYHLEIAKDAKIDTTTDVADGFDAFRKKLDEGACAIFDGYFAPKKKKAKKKR